MSDWNIGNGSEAPEGVLLEVEIEHCNKELDLQNETIKGSFGEDCFYLEDGFNKLSWNWDIVKWRILDE